ncbi:U32 family peptidase, large subunit [Clostridiaceae bacterium JG1575]|nr:U32 family peptidase, large subunit [Clostridiaceae bacterium JG1575]
MKQDHRPELLAPAGNLAKLKTAVDFGADAVYLGGPRLNLRAFADNFSLEEMAEGIAYAHGRGRRVYLTLNVFPHEADLIGLAEYLKEMQGVGVDALIVSDPGIILAAREVIPQMELHLSTQANTVNSAAARFWHQQGIARIVLARELSLEEIRALHQEIPDTLSLEAFIHGAMCMAYSGRCLMSHVMTGRDANRGACAQPCRYHYTVVEEKRPNQSMDLLQDDRGSYIMSAKDLCMIDHLPDLLAAGISSLKIEGRMKSEFYVASVVKAYREALDLAMIDPLGYKVQSAWRNLLENVSHRTYHTGFYYGRTQEMIHAEGQYLRGFDLVAMVLEELGEGRYRLLEKNRLFPKTPVEILRSEGPVQEAVLSDFFDEEGHSIAVANQAAMIFQCKSSVPLKAGDMLVQSAKFRQ